MILRYLLISVTDIKYVYIIYMESDMTEFSKFLIFNIKKHRKRMGLSQYALAELLDITTDAVAKIESGKRFPSERTLNKLSKIFEVKPYQLFIDEVEPFEKERYIDKVYALIIQDIKKRLHE